MNTAIIITAAICLLLALLPCYMTWRNLRRYQPAPKPDPIQPQPATPDPRPSLRSPTLMARDPQPSPGPSPLATRNPQPATFLPPFISLLIPARDESANLPGAVVCALASRGVDLDIHILDDHSTDDTAAIGRAFADADPRVHLHSAPPLPAGWNGKQHACWVLSQRATRPLMAFVDADVRLSPDALAGAAAFLEQSGADLVSGFPRQITRSWLEKLLVPLIHFILLGFLPLARMRRSTHPAYAAGCGQFFLVRRGAYQTAGGHAAIRSTRHDGLRLPRAFRNAVLRTDLFDVTDLAMVRMYRGAGRTWEGLGKNATEALAAPAAIVPWTIILLGGQVLPTIALLSMLFHPLPVPAVALFAGGVALAYLNRAMLTARFNPTRLGLLFHPLAVALLLILQWQALFRRVIGRSPAWRGRREV